MSGMRGCGGQASSEYVALLALVAVVFTLAVGLTSGGIGARVLAGLQRGICTAVGRACPVPTPVRADGPVAALTRARLRPGSALGFWQAVPPVSADLTGRPGLRAALGIGEAPVGLQGTFSLWESGAAVRAFARGEAHTEVVARTEPERWYAEELFARFDVVGSAGTLDGRDPLR